MHHTTSAKAPGKILWLGGYSILERPNVGLVTTVDAFAHASVTLEKTDVVRIVVPQFGKEAEGKVDADGTLAMDVPEELNIVKTALEVSLKYATAKGFKPQGLTLTTSTDAAMAYNIGKDGRVSKSGLGSSAAVTVATVGSALHSMGVNFDENEALHKLSQVSHGIASGKVGSGFDVAAATFGSIIYSRYSPDLVSRLSSESTGKELVRIVNRKWDCSIERVKLPKAFRLLAASITGGAALTTSFVKKVNDFKEKSPGSYQDIIKRLNEENVAAITALKDMNRNVEMEKSMLKFKTAFENGWEITKELGEQSGAQIVDAEVSALIDESRLNGALVAKTPGAGGRDAIVALAKDGDSYERLRGLWAAKKELNLLSISASDGGFELE